MTTTTHPRPLGHKRRRWGAAVVLGGLRGARGGGRRALCGCCGVREGEVSTPAIHAHSLRSTCQLSGRPKRATAGHAEAGLTCNAIGKPRSRSLKRPRHTCDGSLRQPARRDLLPPSPAAGGRAVASASIVNPACSKLLSPRPHHAAQLCIFLARARLWVREREREGGPELSQHDLCSNGYVWHIQIARLKAFVGARRGERSQGHSWQASQSFLRVCWRAWLRPLCCNSRCCF